MANLNKAMLIGNLGADPETSSGVTRISIATTERWTDKSSGEKKERTEWHRVTFFNRLSEIAQQYLRKGSQVYVEGKITTNKYQDKINGEDRYSTEIIANNMQLLDSKGATQNNNSARSDTPPKNAQAGGSPEKPPVDYDDDIPF